MRQVKGVCPFCGDGHVTQLDGSKFSCSRSHYWRIEDGGVEKLHRLTTTEASVKTAMLDEQYLVEIEQLNAPKKLRALRGLDSKKRSYRGIAGELGHSPSTVTMHVARHDSAVEQHGYCPVCRRAGGVLFEDKIKGGG